MQRILLVLVVVLLSGLAIPADLSAQDAKEHIDRGAAWSKKGDLDKAIADFTEAIRLDPSNADAYFDRGLAFNRKGDYDKAIADFNETIRLDPTVANPFFLRGSAWASKGEEDKAIADYTEAIRLNPKFAGAYRSRGATWARKGDADKAIADFNESIRINPNDPTTYITRGYNWKGKGELDRALADFNKAIELDPKSVLAYNLRAMVWSHKGEYDKATADLNRALSINASDVTACNGLAWIYATCPYEKYRDGKKAVESANKAYRLTGGKEFVPLDTLAAAYAESGDFEKAKEWEAKAIEVAAAGKSLTEKKKAELASRLELYKLRKAYRDVAKGSERERQGSDDTRTWTAANGKFTVKAAYVSSDGTTVKLKKADGKFISVPLDRLGDEDQAWVQKRLKP